jgi:hypothetical protein
MKKHWLKLTLVGVLIAAVTVAALAWLGFVPVARPQNEHDFLAEQLRRVRYAGPLRNDAERAIAASLPAEPTIDDLRVAYSRYVSDQFAKGADALLAARHRCPHMTAPWNA